MCFYCPSTTIYGMSNISVCGLKPLLRVGGKLFHWEGEEMTCASGRLAAYLLCFTVKSIIHRIIVMTIQIVRNTFEG